MNTILFPDYVRLIGISSLAGMRTMAPVWLLTEAFTIGETEPAKIELLHTASRVLKVLAVVELILDKMPFTPKRTKPAGLIGRFISGATAGAAVMERTGGRKTLPGALIGGAAAIGAAYISFFARRKLAKSTPIPDAVWGLAEDALVFTVGKKLVAN